MENWIIENPSATQPYKPLIEININYFFVSVSSVGTSGSISINVSVLLTHFGFVYMVLDGLIKCELCVEKTRKKKQENKISFQYTALNGERSSVARDERAKKMNGKIIGLSGSLFEERKMKCIYM